MSKLWAIYSRVASLEAAECDRRDHADLSDDTEPEEEEPPAWERQDGQESEEEADSWRAMAEADGVEDPALLAELDAEMRRQAEEWAQVTGPVAVYAPGDYEEIPW